MQPDKACLLLQLDVEQTAVRDYGANQHTWMEIRIAHDVGGVTTVLIDVQTEGKTPTRIPEFQRLTFRPAGVTTVTLDKLGSDVDALDVVSRGSVHLHSVGNRGTTMTLDNGGKQAQVRAVSLDSSLLSVGRQTAFPTPLQPLNGSELNGGVSFILHNNLWDTNYPAWYPWLKSSKPNSLLRSGDDRFRFEFHFE